MSPTVWTAGIYNLFTGGLVNLIRGKAVPGENGEALLVGLGFIVVIVLSYLLGSVNWAIVVSRVFYHDDIRRHGSGNAGTTNVLRTYGKKAAIVTFLGDGLKGVLSIVLACLIFGFPMAGGITEAGYATYDIRYIHLVTAAYLAAFFAMLGHIFPIFSKFRGGKGFATFLFTVMALNPIICLMLIAIFVIIVSGTHYVSLGSIVTVAFYPILLGSFDGAVSGYGVNTLFAFLMGAIVVWSHRANLRRLLNREESKTYFFKKKKTEPKEPQTEETEEKA